MPRRYSLRTRIREWRENRGWTVEELSFHMSQGRRGAAKYLPDFLRLIEQNEVHNCVSYTTLAVLAQALQISMEDLYDCVYDDGVASPLDPALTDPDRC